MRANMATLKKRISELEGTAEREKSALAELRRTKEELNARVAKVAQMTEEMETLKSNLAIEGAALTHERKARR